MKFMGCSTTFFGMPICYFYEVFSVAPWKNGCVKIITSTENPEINMYCSLSQVIFDKMRRNRPLCSLYLANKYVTVDFLFDLTTDEG